MNFNCNGEWIVENGRFNTPQYVYHYQLSIIQQYVLFAES